jgi:hypothetical protein
MRTVMTFSERMKMNVKLTSNQIKMLKILNTEETIDGHSFDKEFGVGEVRQKYYSDDSKKGNSMRSNSTVGRMLSNLHEKRVINYWAVDDSPKYTISSFGKRFLDTI